jgi:methylated-DNA-[protein]-cysteine S-methyltransferase
MTAILEPERHAAGGGRVGRDMSSRVGVLRAVRTEYTVAGWGVGTLWTRAEGVVLAHELDFEQAPRADDGRSATAPDPESPDVAEIVEGLRAFLSGVDAPLGRVPIDLSWCSPFQRTVAEALRAVPRGEVVSYGELAALAGHPNAQRAVGTFCARNRLMLFVPCHRVVAADGIGGYGSAGVGVKRRLLALEGVDL